jgi:hypothetical protein
MDVSSGRAGVENEGGLRYATTTKFVQAAGVEWIKSNTPSDRFGGGFWHSLSPEDPSKQGEIKKKSGEKNRDTNFEQQTLFSVELNKALIQMLFTLIFARLTNNKVDSKNI